ncbi:class I SAM-dependent methyltransferase, partial [Candidatus Woesearchaeota archaeon]|nr:class I SAM-dependent methyltransferase [Candidatus Woesearchaeota archaeon]
MNILNKEIEQKVGKSHYKNYDDFNRFISYFNQIESIKKTNPDNILEIGVGNNTLSTYLRSKGFDLTTCDFDESLKPDIVADIRKLPFEENQFDTVVAFEILEHLKFKEFEGCLKQLHKVSNKYVIISLPYSGIYLEILIRFPWIKKIIKKDFIRIFLSVPLITHKFRCKQHYWEVGRKGFSKNKVRKLFKKDFIIKEDFRLPISPHHWMLILKK